MRAVNNERKLLFWSVVSLLSIFLAERITYVKAYPMLVEVPEGDERVSD